MRLTQRRVVALALLILVAGGGTASAPPVGALPARADDRPGERVPLVDGAHRTTRAELGPASGRDAGRTPLALWWTPFAAAVTWVLVATVAVRRSAPTATVAPASVRPRGPPSVRLLHTTA